MEHCSEAGQLALLSPIKSPNALLINMDDEMDMDHVAKLATSMPVLCATLGMSHVTAFGRFNQNQDSTFLCYISSEKLTVKLIPYKCLYI